MKKILIIFLFIFGIFSNTYAQGASISASAGANTSVKAGINIGGNAGGSHTVGGLGNSSDTATPINIGCTNCVDEGTSAGNLKNAYTEGKASEHIQNIVSYLIGFLYFIGVLVIIYAGVMILVSNGEEEKVSNAKKTIMYVVIGMIIIFLSGPITNFILELFKQGAK